MITIDGKPAPVVDCDVHESYVSIRALRDRLPRQWQRYFDECGFNQLPSDPYVATAHGGRRADAWPADGGPPGSDYDLMREQLLDRHGVDYAILTGSFYRVSAMPQVEFAVALASAYNDWLVDEWLDRDPRFFGSLQIALQDPSAAAKEIDRMGQHPRIIQVLFPQVADRAFGHPAYDSVYEAVVRNRLTVALHPTGSSGINPPPTVTGSWPRTYFEYHANFALSYQAQLASLVCEGTFVKFPALRIVMLEAGWAWLPHLSWSLDTHWRSLQMEAPWLERKPSEYIREHVLFGTQPVVEPDNPGDLVTMFDLIDGESILIFASDYPHWDFDAPQRALPRAIRSDARRRILGLNALELYGLPEPTNATVAPLVATSD